MKLFRNYIMVVLAGVLFIVLLRQFNLIPAFNDIFGAKPVLIENTPILVREVREMAQLITITAQDEVVVDSVKSSTMDILKSITGISINPLSPPVDRLVLVVKGKVLAGTDLKMVDENDIVVDGDSVSMKLPRATILDVIVNPSDFNTFSETGEWPPETVTKVKMKARNKILNRALDKGILEKADKRCVLLIGNFLQAAGFNKVNLYY